MDHCCCLWLPPRSWRCIPIAADTIHFIHKTHRIQAESNLKASSRREQLSWYQKIPRKLCVLPMCLVLMLRNYTNQYRRVTTWHSYLGGKVSNMPGTRNLANLLKSHRFGGDLQPSLYEPSLIPDCTSLFVTYRQLVFPLNSNQPTNQTSVQQNRRHYRERQLTKAQRTSDHPGPSPVTHPHTTPALKAQGTLRKRGRKS